ncbi:glycosyltransferase family 4 protein [Roseibium suaedae]|uniref:Glycosyltransferase involved in cell wall bisynthesis n=1 Tax=Roseibium suaedae TaxID=735517 RepID=A0A1M7CYV7_9HYPH|nr:glycosyltransferase family 4 protein [Roseibium suaedae]SHL72426.1 Glycosyltransferase involved in cell wall bisynthesis [Roseibium suaedae]
MTSDPLRILHCVRSPIGGIFRHIMDLAASQAAAGHDVGLICDSSTGSAFDNALVDQISKHLSLGVARFPMQRQLTIQDLKATRNLYRHIRDLKPDVLHGHGAKGGAYTRVIGTILRMKGRDVTRIYCPHGGSLHYDPNRLEGRVYHTIERALERITDGLIFVSDYEAAAFETKVCQPRALSRVVYNGLRPEEFSPVQANEDAADFLYIGMLRDLKGTDLFIEALHNIKLKSGTAPSAHIVGEGPDEARYRSMVSKFGLEDKVTFHGALPARKAFAMGRCVVVPSRAEAMPYIILETVAAQRPLIATRVGGIPEIFGRYSSHLVEPGRIESLTSAMEAALAHPEAMERLAGTLRGCLAETFSIDLMSDRIMTLYREVRGQLPEDLHQASSQSETDTLPAANPQTIYARTGQR